MTFDYVIIGAGSAGCVLAYRLSENPAHKVLLIEAGGPDNKFEIQVPAAYSKLHKSRVDWAFYTTPQSSVLNRRMFQPRGKTLGGSSSTNCMAYIRGNAKDYDEWAALGNKGWSYQEMLPYFKKSEHNEQYQNEYHQQGGLLNVSYASYVTPLGEAFIEACETQGIATNTDFNGRKQEGAGLFQFTIKKGQRHSAAKAFLKPALARPNLTVLTKAHVAKIIIEKQRAVGVAYLQGREQKEVRATREVLLSAGSFGSPQILMLSGIGEAEQLRAAGIALVQDLPGVGKNLQDHLMVPVNCLCNAKITFNSAQTPGNILKYLLLKKGPLSASPLEASAFLKTNSSLERPDIQFHFAPVHGTDLYNPDVLPKTDGFIIFPTLLRPESRGQVRLQSADPLAAPLIDPQYLSEEADRRCLIEGFKIAKETLLSAPFGSYRTKLYYPEKSNNDKEILQHILQTVETVYHPVGTCQMGSHEAAVVDSQLRVRGIEGLRVVDASVMPTIITGNTNAPVIAIAEKAADFIIKGA
jgi:choline dehydrogenase